MRELLFLKPVKTNIKESTESDMKGTDISVGGLREDAPAKINLYLHVTGRREDGYHLLDSLVVFVDARDVVRYEPGADPLCLKLAGRFGEKLNQLTVGEDNLVIKAAKKIQALGGESIQGGCLLLEKNLPVASGIGGGSSDAAATLRLLNRVWGVNGDHSALLQISEKLGADIPACLLRQSLRMEGIGERLSSVSSLPHCGIVLVNCGQAVSTPEVFRRRHGAFRSRASMPSVWHDVYGLADFLKEQTNALEAAACELCPEVEKVLHVIAVQDQCLLARMSGSGATCFGLFPSVQQAQRVADYLTHLHQEWWVWGGGLYHEI